MRILKQTLCGAALAFAAMSPVQAHEPMEHACEAPVRPADETNDRLWNAFLDEIDAFRDCVNVAKEQHEHAVRAHQASARHAVEAWNEFVRTSLNAPEDFPWPPEEDG